MTPTEKQLQFANKLFSDVAERSRRLGCAVQMTDFREDMRWLGLDHNDRADVSKYIGMHTQAKNEARMTLRRY